MKQLLPLLTLSLLIISCNSNQSGSTEVAESEIVEIEKRTIYAYPTYEKVSIRETPAKDGKYRTAVYLGEKLVFLDSLATDNSGDKPINYALVQLSDNTSGWIQQNLLAIDKEVGVAVDNLTVHSRPDMVNTTTKQFVPMDFLVIEDTNGNWKKVSGRTGEKNTMQSGWIFSDGINSEEATIKEALVFSKTIKEEDSDQKTEILSTLHENALYRQSPFATYIGDAVSLGSFMPEKYERIFSTWFDFAEVYQDEEDGVTINGDKYGRYHWGLFYLAEGLLHSINKEFGDENAEEEIQTRDESYYTFNWNNGNVSSVVMAMSGIDPLQPDSEIEPFSQINPEFVRWMSQNLIPDPDDNFLGTVNRDIYKDLFNGQIEWVAQGYLETHVKRDIDKEVTDYQQRILIEDEDALEYLYTRYGENDWFAGFWIRREIDDSGPEFFKGMIKFLKLYNPQFYQDNFDGQSYTSAENSGQ